MVPRTPSRRWDVFQQSLPKRSAQKGPQNSPACVRNIDGQLPENSPRDKSLIIVSIALGCIVHQLGLTFFYCRQ